MKKSLFAIAAVTAFAGAAQAQSSVTVYGILDVGFTAGSLANTQPTGVGNTGNNVARISANNQSGSRLGFRGNEDLGGGTSAQFVFELGTNPAAEAVWAPNVRQAFVGLTQKGAGQVRIGTQNSLYWEQGSNMTGQLAQVAGSILAPATNGAEFTGASAAQAAYTVRTTNTINLRSERMSGFLVKASYTLNNSSTSSSAANAAGGFTGGVNDQSGYQVGAEYVAGKANLQASYAGFTSQNPFGAITNAPTCPGAGVNCVGAANVVAGVTPVNWGTNVQGTNVKDNQLLVTASYDFGILRAYAGFADRRAQSTINSNDTYARTGYEIGVRSFITKKIEGWASGGMGTYNPQGVGGNNAKLSAYQVGSNYWLSKRTNLYGIVGANNVDGTAASGINAATAKQEIFQYAVGVRHTF